MSNDKTRTKKHTCSIIIRCCNEEQYIGRLLTGIMEQTLKEREIILVDSGSNDATLSIASRYPVKIVSIEPEEFSFGRSLNVGCAKATGEFFVIASAHVYPVYRDWLEKMIDHFKDPDIAIVYGKQYGGKTARYSENQVFKKWYPDSSIKHQKHPFYNNANSAIRKKVWEQYHFDEELTGLEDLHLAKLVIENGSKIAYDAEAKIIHVHNERCIQIFNRYRREAMAYKHIFPKERFHIWDFIKLLAINVVLDYYHAFNDRVLVKNIFSILSFRFMHFSGTYSGYKQHGSITQQLRNRFYYPNGFIRKRAVVDDKREKELLIDYEHY